MTLSRAVGKTQVNWFQIMNKFNNLGADRDDRSDSLADLLGIYDTTRKTAVDVYETQPA